ncbi:MAG: carboxypeptidase-like regulatory domain-containing protein [Prevotella sp.]|nr:carboxypeptidase-like regulatory domain-containing protein [Prevotella sp.]
MRRYLIFMLTVVMALAVSAQQKLEVISGIVIDRDTKTPLVNVSISVDKGSLSTVTNADGRFSLKTVKRPSRIVVSHIGYRTRYVTVPDDGSELRVPMASTSVMLSDIVVMPEDPLEVLLQALNRVVDNYGKSPRLMQTFYRETVQKRQRYIYIAEAVGELLKTGYHRASSTRDWVSVLKGRRLVSTRQSDTLGVKIQGGPVLMNTHDVVKNRNIVFDPEIINHYNYFMEMPAKIDDRLQIVISFHPRDMSPDALYHGLVYIDNENYTITRVELSLDMQNREMATNMMLVKKPAGLKFKPKELSLLVTFKRDGEFSRINYMRTEMKFSCDWKRRLLSTTYTAITEMVVTDQLSEIKGKPESGTFGERDSIYDKMSYFDDPAFWADYNIIEPTESLENAVKKIKRQR